MILDDVNNALSQIDSRTFYGTAAKLSKDANWDYFVFSRRTLARNANRSSYADAINVAIVREDYIPDGLPEQVIDAMESLPGIRLASDDGQYDYTVKPGTNDTVEMLVLTFIRSRKKT